MIMIIPLHKAVKAHIYFLYAMLHMVVSRSLFRRRCDTFCTSGFMDNVVFAHSTQARRPLKVTHQRATTNRGRSCYLRLRSLQTRRASCLGLSWNRSRRSHISKTIVVLHGEEIRWERLKLRDLMLKYNRILGLIL